MEQKEYSSIELPMLGYLATDTEITIKRCYARIEVVCTDTITDLPESLGHFNLSLAFDGEDIVCSFDPYTHPMFLNALFSSSSYSFQVFSMMNNINMKFNFYNATDQELWVALQVGVITSEGSDLEDNYFTVMSDS